MKALFFYLILNINVITLNCLGHDNDVSKILCTFRTKHGGWAPVFLLNF